MTARPGFHSSKPKRPPCSWLCQTCVLILSCTITSQKHSAQRSLRLLLHIRRAQLRKKNQVVKTMHKIWDFSGYHFLHYWRISTKLLVKKKRASGCKNTDTASIYGLVYSETLFLISTCGGCCSLTQIFVQKKNKVLLNQCQTLQYT